MSRAPNTPLPAGWVAPGWIVGLDLSLTGLGMVAVPCAWDLDFTRVLRRSLESDPKAPLVDRIRDLAIDVQRWVDWVGSRHNCAPSVFLEAPVTHAAYSLVPLAKLSGVVQHELRREMGIVCREAPQQDIRKLLLGKVPQRDRKAAIVQVVRAMVPDPEEWDDDQCDAFAVANYGLAQLESPFVTIARAA